MEAGEKESRRDKIEQRTGKERKLGKVKKGKLKEGKKRWKKEKEMEGREEKG